MFGVFMAGVPISSGNGTEGRDMPGWCIGSVKGKLVSGVVIGGQCMPREFWDEAPACCDVVPVCCVEGVLKVTSGLMGGLMGGTNVPDGLIWVSIGGGLDVIFKVCL